MTNATNLICILLLAGCADVRGVGLTAGPPDCPLQGDALLTRIQEQTFRYFWDGAEPNSGMALERIHIDGYGAEEDRYIVTTGGSGFGLMAILVGIERSFITAEEGLERFERIVDFLDQADRFHGAWPHWLDGRTGRTVRFSDLDDGADLVETAFLLQGLLAVRQYYRNGSERERRLAERINRMWREVDWNWFRQSGQNVLYWHWSPNHGWAMNHQIRGYDEAMLVYILAASSPTHAIPAEVYHEGWARGGAIRMKGHEQYGYSLPLRHNGAEQYGGPLFWAHYSFLGLDPRGLEDQYGDYWKNNRHHTLINRQWAMENPNGCAGYGARQWGLTSSYTRIEEGAVGYTGHAPGHNDRCVISPTAALSSIPYTPDESMEVAAHLYNEMRDWVWGPYGFYDAFSVEYQWYPPRYLAIDQGPIVVMIENHRTGMLWDLFMTAPEVLDALQRLGFSSPHL